MHKLSAKYDLNNIRAVGEDDEDKAERKIESESMILVKALMDCNVPKFLADDIVLFKGITLFFFFSLYLVF